MHIACAERCLRIFQSPPLNITALDAMDLHHMASFQIVEILFIPQGRCVRK